MSDKKNLRGEVKILTGRHAGVEERFPLGMYLVGSSFDADIVLTDDELSPRHFRLGIGSASLRVEAVDGQVNIDGRLLSPGEAHTGRYPAQIAVGSVKLVCNRISTSFLPKNAIKTLRQHAVPAGVAVGACAIVVAWLASTAAKQDVRPPARLAAKPEPVLAATNPNQLSEKTAAASAGLSERLSAANIRVAISKEAGIVMARGSIDPASAPAWRDAQLWFDKTFGPDVVLVSEIVIAARKDEVPPLNIQSVWAGETPYVMDARGEKHFEGALLSDGWVLERIEADKVTLRRSAEIMTLRL